MKKRFTVLLAALLLFTSVSFTAAAGLSVPSFSVFLQTPGERLPMRGEMIWYNSKSVSADGLLHFMPLDKWMEKERESLPAYTVSAPLTFGAEAGENCTEAYAWRSAVYPVIDGVLQNEYATWTKGDPVTFFPGQYLIVTSCYVAGTDGSGQFAGVCLLTVPETPATAAAEQ